MGKMERVGALAAKEFQVGPGSGSYGLCSQARLGAAQKKPKPLSAVVSSIGRQEPQLGCSGTSS